VTEIPALVERVVTSIAGLVALGETIEDEWTYVHDLELVWVARLRAVAAERAGADGAGGLPSSHLAQGPALDAAIERLCDEAARITDPHRAIDWLSTLPQATLVALGEAAW
jgi:hypothetical protein